MSDVHQGFPTYRRIAPLDGKAAHPEEARRIAANIAKLLTRPRLNTGFR
jgi:hypothetical protein